MPRQPKNSQGYLPSKGGRAYVRKQARRMRNERQQWAGVGVEAHAVVEEILRPEDQMASSCGNSSFGIQNTSHPDFDANRSRSDSSSSNDHTGPGGWDSRFRFRALTTPSRSPLSFYGSDDVETEEREAEVEVMDLPEYSLYGPERSIGDTAFGGSNANDIDHEDSFEVEENEIAGNADDYMLIDWEIHLAEDGQVIIDEVPQETVEPDPVDFVFRSLVSKEIGLEFMMLARRHRLTYAAMDDILNFIFNNRAKIPSLPTSYARLNTLVNRVPLHLQIAFQCSECNDNSVYRYSYKRGFLKNTTCQVPRHSSFTYNMGHYVMFDVKQVLRLALPCAWDIRKSEFISPCIKEQFRNLGLSLAHDISVTLNLDGVTYSKHGGRSIWPLLGYIDGVPASKLNSNVIMFGVWLSPCYSNSKPNFQVFLQPIINQFNRLLEEGLTWRNFPTQIWITSKVFISRVLCDSMARPAVQYLQQFNGLFGCSYCVHEGSNWYYSHTEPMAYLRTDAEHRRVCALPQYSLVKISVLKGVTGVSPFLQLPYFDIIKGFPPDIMHGVYLGVAKNITMSWIEPANAYHFTRAQINEINEVLLSVKPPTRVTRSLPNLNDCGKWKAHQWGLWLLYYSPVILKDILEDRRYQHWMKLVFAISLLVKPTIFEGDFDVAEMNLEDFSRDILTHYGERKCTFNVHLLRHLVYFCKLYGPLHTFSMYPFENFNLYFKGSITDSQGVGLQTCQRYMQELKIVLRKKMDVEVRQESRLLCNICTPRATCYSMACCEVGEKHYFAKYRCANGNVLYSVSYTALKTRDSTYMLTTDGMVVQILYFYMCSNHPERLNAAVKRFRIQNMNMDVDHVFVATDDPARYVSVPVESLGETLLHIERGGRRYFVEFRNTVEHVCE